MSLKTSLNKIFNNMNPSIGGADLPQPYEIDTLRKWQKQWFKKHPDLKLVQAALDNQTTLKGTKNALKIVRGLTDDNIVKLVIEFSINELTMFKQMRQLAKLKPAIENTIHEQSDKVFGDFKDFETQVNFIRKNIMPTLSTNLEKLLGAKKYRKNPYLNHWPTGLKYLNGLDDDELLKDFVNQGAFKVLEAKCFPEGYKVASELGVTFEYANDLQAFISRPNQNVEATLAIVWINVKLLNWLDSFYGEPDYGDGIFSSNHQLGMDSELVDSIEELYPTENAFKRAFFKFNSMRDIFTTRAHKNGFENQDRYMDLWHETNAIKGDRDRWLAYQVRNNMDVGFNVLLGGVLEELADFDEGDAD